MPRVYVSVGSNVEREKNVRGAIRALRARFGDVELSRVYQTKAEGFDGDDFYNLVAAFDTALSVSDVQGALAEIESAHGRTRGTAKFAPRTLDIDLLLYGDLVQHDGAVNVPRPDLLRYEFMLGPLAEIAPTASHPEIGVDFAQLWREHRGHGTLRVVPLELPL